MTLERREERMYMPEEVAALKARIAKLEGALRWYAKEETYLEPRIGVLDHEEPLEMTDIYGDKGQRAREALSED